MFVWANSCYDIDIARGNREEEKEMEVGENIYEYKECLRNHAASLGSNATDGCREFTPSNTGDTSHCAACGCHRNFHRRVAFSSGGVSCSSSQGGGSQKQNHVAVESPQEWEIRSPKKRLRTKFTPEQKEKMFGFADKLGWKMHRGKEEGNEIEGFCTEIGVSKKVFKVWMHNHKNNSTYPSSI